MPDTIEIVTTRMPLSDVDDKLAAEFGADAELVRKGYISIKAPEILEGERAVISVISSEIVDRDREVMLVKGLDLKWYRKNPVVMYGHSHVGLPIGKNQWIRKDKGRVMAKTIFATEDQNPLAEQVYQLFKGGFLRAWSVGFIVLESRDPKPDEFEDPVTRVITKWVLLEYSAVPVPANMEALTTAVGKGLSLSKELKADLGMPVTKEELAEGGLLEIEPKRGWRQYAKIGSPEAEAYLARMKAECAETPRVHMPDEPEKNGAISPTDPELMKIHAKMREFQATLDNIEKTLEPERPPEILITATSKPEEPEPPTITLPSDFGKTLTEALGGIVHEGLDRVMDKTIDRAKGHVKESE